MWQTRSCEKVESTVESVFKPLVYSSVRWTWHPEDLGVMSILCGYKAGMRETGCVKGRVQAYVVEFGDGTR
jgi:hypothetical protein